MDGPPPVKQASVLPQRIYRKDPKWTNHVQVPTPITDRRLSGDHWWDPDRIAHVSDMPKFCPGCGVALDGPGSMSVEYWQGDKRVYHTNCEACGWSGDIAKVERMVGPEAPH